MPYDGPGELAAALDDFDERIIMDPLAYSEIRTRPSLEERLESIISGAALMVCVVNESVVSKSNRFIIS